MLHVPSNLRLRTERALSAIGFVLVLASWACAYVVVCPADRAHPVHVARVIR